MLSTRTIALVCMGWVLGWIATSGAKSQTVRLLDVGIIGPLMIWGGMTSTMPVGFGFVLTFFGATTMTYNLRNYLAEAKKSQQQ